MANYWIKRDFLLFNIYDYIELENLPKEKIGEFLNGTLLYTFPFTNILFKDKKIKFSYPEGRIVCANIDKDGNCRAIVHSDFKMPSIIHVKSLYFDRDSNDNITKISGIWIRPLFEGEC